jgi:hypothetical protein
MRHLLGRNNWPSHRNSRAAVLTVSGLLFVFYNGRFASVTEGYTVGAHLLPSACGVIRRKLEK